MRKQYYCPIATCRGCSTFSTKNRLIKHLVDSHSESVIEINIFNLNGFIDEVQGVLLEEEIDDFKDDVHILMEALKYF
jgi:hypothetical protein